MDTLSLLALISLYGVGVLLYAVNARILPAISSARAGLMPVVLVGRFVAGVFLTVLMLLVAGAIGDFLAHLAGSTGLLVREPVPSNGYHWDLATMYTRMGATVLGAVSAYLWRRRAREHKPAAGSRQ